MADLHRFFYPGDMMAKSIVALEPDTTKHIWQVLRMNEGDHLMLTDGKGTVAKGQIDFVERHKCTVLIQETEREERNGNKLHLCVGFTKNNSRNEWLLEKATELGVASIMPLASARYQKTHIRHDRWSKILQSAILQSQQSYLPELMPVTSVQQAIETYKNTPQKLIAHCIAEGERHPMLEMLKPSDDAVIFIGPEGDFNQDEVDLCLSKGFTAVSLGNNRLRTETAAMAVAAYYNLIS